LLAPCILAFLAPIAVYCWVLAAVNRRDRPTMVHGLWDCVGMLLALGGILFIVVPVLLNRFFVKLLDELPFAEDDFEARWEEVMRQWWFFWGGYFTLLLVAIGLMLWWRRSKTVIYNVDPDRFGQVLHDGLQRLDLVYARVGDRLLIAAKPLAQDDGGDSSASEAANKRAASPATLRGEAELLVEVFPSMCNVSLHWLRSNGNMRAAIEKQLNGALEAARIFDNPAANWFMGVTGLLFGLVFLSGAIWIMTAYFFRHW
jgi:hypothetical protein